jgi:hypothetical protein
MARSGKLTAQYGYRFTPEQYARLEALAVKTNSVATHGPRARLPSVATLFARIADEEIIFVEKEPWSLPAGLAEQAAEIERQERQEHQERVERLERQRRVEQHTVAKQAERKTPVKMTQLSMLEPA